MTFTAVVMAAGTWSEARVRIGPAMPDSHGSWEVAIGEGQTAQTLRLFRDKAYAEEFARGYNAALLRLRVVISQARRA